jgi:SAM-dependent methyltransferase
MTVSADSARYFCRFHGRELAEAGGEACCEECERNYQIREGIWMLDVMNRPDRAAFDEQVLAQPIPLDLEKARRMLAAAGAPKLRGANILDVGCGLGDLTYGLAQADSIADSDIYAFDHSVESLRRAAAVNSAANNNRVHFSAQDAMRLFFADNSFDLVAGCAVIHHFLDYPGFLREVARILKPGGVAVFAEPFFDGYLWPAFILKNAIEECGLDVGSPEFARTTILESVSFMSRHRGNAPALEILTDKHCFRESELILAASEAGFATARFIPYEPPEFSGGWMAYFLEVYGVTHPEVCRSAIAQFARLKELVGPLLADIVSHFKYIVLRKAEPEL